MNWQRGLFRAWVLVSALWVIASLALACVFVPDKVRSERYQYLHATKFAVDHPSRIDWSRPFYDIIHSPSARAEDRQFSGVDAQYATSWDEGVEQGVMILVQILGKLYLNAALTDVDRKYITEAFAKQRWQRWMWAILPWLALMLLPPVALFAIGLSALWVWVGFKQA